MLSHKAVGRGLVLPQPNVPDFIDSPYSFGGVDGRWSRSEASWGEEGWEIELWFECKMKFKK